MELRLHFSIFLFLLNYNLIENSDSETLLVIPKVVNYNEEFTIYIKSSFSDNENATLQLTCENEVEDQIYEQTFEQEELSDDQLLQINAGRSEIINLTAILEINSEKIKVNQNILINDYRFDEMFVFIITDKDFYKLNEMIKIQVIVLNDKLKIENFDDFTEPTLKITDSEENVVFIAQIEEESVSLTDTESKIYSFEYQIDDSIVLGSLNITLHSEYNEIEKLMTSKIIQIIENNQPNIKLIVNSVPQVSFSDDYFSLNVSAIYLNEFTVYGTLKYEIKILDQNTMKIIKSQKSEEVKIYETQLLNFDVKKFFEISKASNVIVKFFFELEDSYSYEVIQSTYQILYCSKACEEKNRSNKNEDENYLKITSTSKLYRNQEIELEIKSSEFISSLNVIVKSGPLILYTDTKNIYDETFSYSFDVTEKMLKGIEVFIYSLDDNGDIFLNNSIIFKNELKRNENEMQNPIKIELSSYEVKPEDNVTVTINADPFSTVSIVAISKTYKTESFFDFLKNTNLNKIIKNKNDLIFMMKNQNQTKFSTFTFKSKCESNLKNDKILQQNDPLHHDSWIFEKFKIQSDGKYEFIRNTPRKYLTWSFYAFSAESDKIVELSSKPVDLKVTKDFFIDFNLPSSTRFNDVLRIDVFIMHKLTKFYSVNVTISRNEKLQNFIIMSKLQGSCKFNATEDVSQTKPVPLVPNKPTHVVFYIKPISMSKDQSNNVVIKAEDSELGLFDEKEHFLSVEHELLKYHWSEIVFIDLNKKSKFSTFKEILLTEEISKKSVNVEVSLSTNLINEDLLKVEKLMNISSLGSEDDMIKKKIQSMMALIYLSKFRNIFDEIFKDFVNDGVDKIFQLQNQDGSFSFKGHGKFKSIWLTAYILEFFGFAKEFVDIEDHLIAKGFQFLERNQRTDGNYEEFSYETNSRDYKLTAQVLFAFNKHPKYYKEKHEVVTKIQSYLHSNNPNYIKNLDIFMVANALPSELSSQYLYGVKDLMVFENDYSYFEIISKNKSKIPIKEIPEKIEIASYALIYFLNNNRKIEVEKTSYPLMKWLTRTINQHHDVFLTSDSFAIMKALIICQEVFGIQSDSMNVKIKNNLNQMNSLQINKANFLTSQNLVLNSKTQHVSIEAEGKGFAMLEISYQYGHKAFDSHDEKLSIEVNTRNIENDSEIELKVCIVPKYEDELGSDLEKEVIVEIEFPDGYAYNLNSLYFLQNFNIKKFFIKQNRSYVNLQFEKLKNLNRCMEFRATRNNEMKKRNIRPAVRAHQLGILSVNYYQERKKC